MHFDYRDKWRMWTRDRLARSEPWLNGAPGPMFTKRTDFWFNHYCEGFEHKKVKGKVKPLKGYKHRYDKRYEDGFLIRYCEICGAKMDVEIQDYFAKALELWRLSAP